MAINSDSVAATADEIARYLDGHPDAADSIEGIRRWWISRQPFDEGSSRVQRALDKLVAEGVIATRSMPDGRVVYFRAPARATGPTGQDD